MAGAGWSARLGSGQLAGWLVRWLSLGLRSAFASFQSPSVFTVSQLRWPATGPSGQLVIGVNTTHYT